MKEVVLAVLNGYVEELLPFYEEIIIPPVLDRLPFYERFHWTSADYDNTPAEELEALRQILPVFDRWREAERNES